MPGIPEPGFDSRTGGEGFLELHGLDEFENELGVPRCIGRLHRWLVGAVGAPVAALDVLLPYPRGVGQHHAEQVQRRVRAPDRPVVAFRDQPRQQAAVVDMGVGHQHPIDLAGIECEGLAVEGLQAPRALEKAAINQQPAAIEGELHARACHRQAGAVDGQGRKAHGGSWRKGWPLRLSSASLALHP